MCLTKIIKVNPETGFSSLVLTWASKSNCMQRSGRAGRVMNGRCYRFIHKKAYVNINSLH